MPADTPPQETVSALLRDLARHYADLLQEVLGPGLVSVVLFGSVARGEASPDSDVDLLIVCDGLPEGRFARLRRLEAADRQIEPLLAELRSGGIRTRLVPLLKTREEAARTVPLYLDLAEDARLLYDHHGFFAGVLARLRASLERLGAERRRRGRVRYWILKRDFTPGEVFDL